MSKLTQMQARFQQKQLQEKEEKLLKMYETQQQRAIERVGRSSAGSNLSNTLPAGKVRQMFEERRQKAGIDRSYPLQPLKNSRANSQQPLARAGSLDRLSKNKITSSIQQSQKTTVQRSVTHVRNGKSTVAKTNNSTVATNRRAYQKVDNNNEEDENDSQQLEALMNNHNLNGNIDDEEFPEIGLDDLDSTQTSYNYLVTGKLPNVGGKHPSELVQGAPPTARNDNRAVRANGVLPNKYNPPMRKEAQPPVIKQTVTKQPTVRKQQTSLSNNRTSPAKSISPPQSYTDSEMDKKQIIKQQSTVSEPTKSASNGNKAAPRTPTKSMSNGTKTGHQSAVTKDDLVACRICSRRFAADRLQKHESICGKTAQKKRKPYDPIKHRVQGTELEPFVKRPSKSGKSHASSVSSSKSTNKKSDWRKKHEDFIATIRAAKLTQQHLAKGGKLSDLPPPPPSYNPDYIQCPHCGRRFNESAAERHIPKCATMIHNKPQRLTGPTTTSAASKRRN